MSANSQQIVFRLPLLRSPLLWAILLSTLAWALYLSTLRPGLLPADSGEFQWVAATLGLAHPPGFPLYTLLAYLFTLLPGDAARNVNLFSSITSAATLALFFLILSALIDHSKRPTTSRVGRRWPLDATGIATVLLGTGTTFWAQATTTNIRSLTGLFAALLFYFLVKWALATDANRSPAPLRAPFLFAAALGLGVTHHLSLLFMGGIMVVWLLWQDRSLLTKLQRLLAFVGAGLIGLLPLLYLPWREPELRQIGPFMTYILGLGFSNDFFFVTDWPGLWQRLTVMGNVLTFQWPAIVLWTAAVGLLFLIIHQRSLAILMVATFGIHLFVTATYRAPQTVEYMLPAYIPLMLLFGYGLYHLLCPFFDAAGEADWLSVLPSGVRLGIGLLLLLALLYAPAQRIVQNGRSYRWLASQHDTLDLTRGWLDDAPQGSVILADWHWFTPLNYLRSVAGVRPDVDIEFVNPRSDSYGRDWAESITAHLDTGRPVIATHFDPDTYTQLPPYLPLEDAVLFPQMPLQSVPADFVPLDLQLGAQIDVVGLRLPDDPFRAGERQAVEIAWRELELDAAGQPWKLFLHLVDNSGRLVAQADLAPQIRPAGYSLTRFELTPRPGGALGGATLLLGAYRLDGTPLPDGDANPRSVVAETTIGPTVWRPVTLNPAPFWQRLNRETGMRLIGEDRDTSQPGQLRVYRHYEVENNLYWTEVETLPADHQAADSVYIPLGEGLVWTGATPALADLSPIPGQKLAVTQHLIADRPILRDYGVAVRLIGLEADQFTWAWLNPDEDRDVPATGAIPTLKWVVGSEIAHPRFLTIPPAAEPGQTVEGFLSVYDLFTRRQVPILDERITNSGRPWIVFDRGTIGLTDGRLSAAE